MLQTSLYLPSALHQRLVIAARETRKSVSQLARELLEKGLAGNETTRIKRMYAGFKRLESIGQVGIANGSTTIDQALYGDDGPWRGDHE